MGARVASRLAGWAVRFSGRRGALLAVGLAVGLALPCLWTGWQLDDHFLRAAWSPKAGLGVAPWDAFGFVRPDSPNLTLWYQVGIAPWWTAPEFRAAFFRPLSSLTHWLDFQLWPQSPIAMHGHSLAWFALVVALAARLYRQIGSAAGSPPVTSAGMGLALLLFAVDDGHGQAVGWIASRSALISASFGLLALLWHDAWRRKGWRLGGWLAPLALLAALAAGEAAVAVLGYLFAYSLTLDPHSRVRRLAALLPAAGCVVIWRLAYAAMECGVAGSGLYTDPLNDPTAYLSSLPQRFGVLLLGQWGFPPTELVSLAGVPWDLVGAVSGWILLLTLGWCFYPLLRRSPVARFWGLGSLLALFPAAATLPSGRLLVFAGLGGMGVLGEYLLAPQLGLVDDQERGRARRLRSGSVVVVALFGVHLVLAPLLLPVTTAAMALLGKASVNAALSIPPDPELAGRDWVIVSSPDFLMLAAYIPLLRLFEDLPGPRSLRVLATGAAPLHVTRLDATTLRLESESGFPAGLTDPVYRSSSNPLQSGEQIEVPGLVVEIEAVSDGHRGDLGERALAASFRFSVPLEEKVWFTWQGDGYRTFALPPLGETVAVPPAELPFF